jgi:formate C-acetyltransferase
MENTSTTINPHRNFREGFWNKRIDLRDFVQKNYTQYDGDETFLSPATKRTENMWQKLSDLIAQETAKGILDLDTKIPSTITSHKPGYIDQPNEIIVGLQTDAPLKRGIKPNGGIKLVVKAAEAHGYTIDPEVIEIFNKYRKTHNDGVFDIYNEEIRKLRSKHIVTGLPDNYSRGRIIGDYRRVALYGLDHLITEKENSLKSFKQIDDEWDMRFREETSDQLTALKDMKIMAESYGYDISLPANDSKEAVQWLYFAYLAAVKEQDGAAMSFGRVDDFLDIYFERDLADGTYTESQIQEFIDDFVMKLRIIRYLRAPAYDELFAGDPTWVTLVLAGSGLDGRSMVTKTSFRFLHTLTNLGAAPEPNLTVLWGQNQSQAWKRYCAKVSIESSSIQYENDDLMKPYYGDDYGIACCVSGMAIGKEMQFFGARANMGKLLLLAINGGREEPLDIEAIGDDGELGGDVIIPHMEALAKDGESLNFDEVWPRFVDLIDWLAERYVMTMNVIHYSHDKYHYENSQMALHDDNVKRFMAFGAAGLSVVADSLSAIKHAKVNPKINGKGVASGYDIQGDYPKYGNDDDRVDGIAVDIVNEFIKALRRYDTYRESVHTLSILTITSNVVYGNATGATPDGRLSREPFAPGANPMHGRDSNGALASLNSVAKIPYESCQDGVSNTFSMVPSVLGGDIETQKGNLVQILDGYMIGKGGHHLNVNVLNRETLMDAQAHPEKYPQLTIRVSGYAVLFNRLSKAQQDEVMARTFHGKF